MLRAPVFTVDCELVGQGCGGAIQTSGQEHGPATQSAKSTTGLIAAVRPRDSKCSRPLAFNRFEVRSDGNAASAVTDRARANSR